MKRILAIGFLAICTVFLMFESGRMTMSWLAYWTNSENILFKDQDAKLLFLWVVIIFAAISYFVWPNSFRARPKFGKSQIISIAFAISGILALQKIVFADGYLSVAENYGRTNEYVVCDEKRYKYFGELQMARNLADCQ